MTTSNNTTYCIYSLACFRNLKVYIGQTVSPNARKRRHFTDLRRQKHKNKQLQRAFNLYGEESFYFEVIEYDIAPSKINDREKYWIEHFDSYHNGFNLTLGGDSTNPILGKQVVWNGITYPSIKSLARAQNVTPIAVARWIRKGFSCDKDREEVHGVACEWNGVNYPSVSAAARANGITDAGMHRRLNAGYSDDNDKQYRRISCEWNGVKYSSVDLAAQANGITNVAMGRRLKAGYTCDTDMKRKRISQPK